MPVVGWEISGEELEGSDLVALTVTDTDTGWTATRVLGPEELTRIYLQVREAQELHERTGEIVTLDASLLFPGGSDDPAHPDPGPPGPLQAREPPSDT